MLKPTARNANSIAAHEIHLQGYRRILARSAWIVIVVPALILFVANIPAYFASLHRLAPPAASTYQGQITLADVHKLQALGLSLDVYAVCMLVVSLVFQFSYAIVGTLIFCRKSDTRMALLASFSLIMLPFGYADLTLQALPPGWRWLIPVLISLANASIMLSAYVFPDGRFVPRWIRWLALVMIVYAASLFWITNGILSLLLLAGFGLSTVAVQIYRYRYTMTAQEQQQAKWVVFGIAIAVTGNLGTRLITGFVLFPLFPDSFLPLAFQVIFVSLAMLVIPPTLAIAILRSRLWDIDVIINRALVYATLSGTIAIIYFGSIVGLQFLMHGFMEGNQLALVISTLVIAALFQPLRRSIQNGIDRRFYRHKYDAVRILNAFSTSMRDEVDLHTLTERLVGVVEEAMQPAHVSLWLRSPETPNKRRTRLLPGVDEEAMESNWEKFS